MARRFLTEEMWERLAPLLPPETGGPGPHRLPNREIEDLQNFRGHGHPGLHSDETSDPGKKANIPFGYAIVPTNENAGADEETCVRGRVEVRAEV